MTQYNTLNVRLPNSHLNKLESGEKNWNEVTLNLSSNLIGNANNVANRSHKLLLNDIKIPRLLKAVANGSSANIKFSKTQLSKVMQSGGIRA